jgi:hypothetical protein
MWYQVGDYTSFRTLKTNITSPGPANALPRVGGLPKNRDDE